MPQDSTLKIRIGNHQVVVDDPSKIKLGIDYKLEDPDDFQKKKGSEATSIRVPATLMNDVVGNTYHQPGIEDLTDGQVFRNFQPAIIEAAGTEIFIGKAKLNEATHTDKPEDYEYDLFGNNLDWSLPLKETTLYDLLQHISFTFTKAVITGSWSFDGTDEQLPYLFAPTRYRDAMTDGDYNMLPEYMRPALSQWWILYWAFKSQGYRISSEFFSTSFFRRRLMPWTWGNFLFSDGTRLSNLDFLAKGLEDIYIEGDFDDYVDLRVTNDSVNGAFDNNDCYSYNGVLKEMKWTYKSAFNYGILDARFHIAVYADATATANSDVKLVARWYKNNVQQGDEDTLVELDAPAIGRRDFIGVVDKFRTIRIQPDDFITVKFFLHIFDSGLGRGNISMHVDAFELEYFRIPLGGQIDFANYTAFKKYKFIDYFRGVVDEWNLSFATDCTNKILYIEPTHNYLLPGETEVRKGFFNGDFVDWSSKQDLSKKSIIRNYSDLEREQTLRYKNDNNDGLQKVVQDRYQNILASGKYVLPERFKADKKAIENRFFSPVMHYDVDQWKAITGTAPQMIALVPENISNTSNSEAQNTFLPKSVYYKGMIAGWGWRFDTEDLTAFPFMFAVNYKPGGENDPVSSYSDEKIGNDLDGYVIAQGLLKRFFLQRMAITRNGEWYTTWFRLNNYDVGQPAHREFKVCQSQRWELVNYTNYNPLSSESTQCMIRKWVPVAPIDDDNTFPSEDSVLNDSQQPGFDTKYARLKCLTSDIPK